MLYNSVYTATSNIRIIHLLKGPDCRLISSALGLFYYEATLL